MFEVQVTVRVDAATHAEAVKRIEDALAEAKRNHMDTLDVDTVDAVRTPTKGRR